MPILKNKIKTFLLKIYTFTLNTPEKTNQYQKKIRDIEWEAIKPYIKRGGKFLDVGAGAGYSMFRAQEDFQCEVFGIDKEPMKYGVKKSNNSDSQSFKIIKAEAENLPFKDESFDIVFSSHFLEHAKEPEIALKEMIRVLKKDGIIIIIVPSALMALISWITQLLLTTHIKVTNLFFWRLTKVQKPKWWEIFIPLSHSYPNKTILLDLKNYRLKKWKSLIAKFMVIEKILFPAIYPFPEYIQLFKPVKNKRLSSSYIFICKKKI